MRSDRRKPDSQAQAEQARRAVLGLWRRTDAESEQQGSLPRARSLQGLVPHVLQGLGLERKQSETELLRAWVSLMDPAVTAHARPAGLRNGTLFVNVDSHVWLEEIVRYRRREILERLQHSFGRQLVARVSFRVG